MPQTLPLVRHCCSPDRVVGGAYAEFQRDQHSQALCHHPKESAATRAAWKANEQPVARFSGGNLERHMSASQRTSAILLKRTERLSADGDQPWPACKLRWSIKP